MPSQYAVEPSAEVEQELRRIPNSFDNLINEAIEYLEDGDSTDDDMAIARMFIQRGYSEDLAYWLVREAEVRHAPGN